MDGKIIIRSSNEINFYDKIILDNLLLGFCIHIVNAEHACKGNKQMFDKLCRNLDSHIRVILITPILKNEFEIMEETYYYESRRTLPPCPKDPLEKFHWDCPLCGDIFQ